MMKIIPVAGRTCALDGRQLIGLYDLGDGRCVLLDSGPVFLREEIRDALARAGLTVAGVLGTHVHFDHFGNAAWFQKQGAQVCLSMGEAELCRTLPTLKSNLFVYSAGEVMSNPLLREMPCLVDRVVRDGEKEIEFCGARFGILRTPGHSPEHISVITPDGVCYVGDALMCGETLRRSKLPYACNIRQYIESVGAFRGCGYRKLLIAHKGIEEPPYDDLLRENEDAVLLRLRAVGDIIDHQMSLEEIFTAVRDTMQIRVDTPHKAENMERFLRPYLECLIDDGTHRLSLRGTGTLCYEPAPGAAQAE